MSTSTAVAEQQIGQRKDFRLLLQRLEKADFEEKGTAFVVGAFRQEPFWQEFTADELLRLAAVTQQHGLHDQCLAIFTQLNDRYPDCAEGWSGRLELLQLLGRNDQVATLAGRMAGHLPPEKLAELKQQLSLATDNGLSAEEDVTDPFINMRREQENIQLFQRLFRGREEVFARQWADRQQGKQGYVPVQRPLMPEDIQEHLQGRKTYGIYLLNKDNCVWTGVIDIDLVARLRNPGEMKKANAQIKREAIYLLKRIRERADSAGLAAIAELSGGKGYHLWFPSSGPVVAAIMKKAMLTLVKDLAADCTCFSIEVFPKQDVLSGKGFGNLVKLPLGVHRGTGRNSRLIPTKSSRMEDQFGLLRLVEPAPPEKFAHLGQVSTRASVVAHPRQAAWAEKYPELAQLSRCCSPLGQVIAMVRSNKQLSLREEKVLLGVLSHLPRGRYLLHHLFESLPEYNRPLLDYKISRVRGTPLGCKRIHSLLEDHGGDLPCVFSTGSYPHPLLHLKEYTEKDAVPVSEKVTNLQDAMLCLKTAVEQVQRFL